jgi:hypothetical protein
MNGERHLIVCTHACTQAYNEKIKDVKTRKTFIMYNRKEERRAKKKKKENIH